MKARDQIASDREMILSILEESDIRLTPQAFIKAIKNRLNLSTKDSKKRLQHWVDAQELCYQYHYGATYVEKSFLRPVQVSPHIILKPLGSNIRSNTATGIEITIEQGISFGSGHHPTTQLCLNAIDHIIFDSALFSGQKNLSCADIGTGSGVLALALVKSGFKSCNAYEIDPVSVHEANKNVQHNSCERKIHIIAEPMTAQKEAYAVICANLRYPTLKAIAGMIHESLIQNGVAIISGVREWEKNKLCDHFSNIGFQPVWQADKKQWSAFVLSKNL